jgi:hypothetical protein
MMGSAMIQQRPPRRAEPGRASNGMIAMTKHLRPPSGCRGIGWAALVLLPAMAWLLLWPSAAIADRIKHQTAVFAGLDKITGRIISFEVATDETVQFGSLQITPKVCFTRPATEAPQTTSFVEVDEISATTNNSNEYKRIFTGWMFASSPGLHGIEHPVYDVWLTECKGGTEVISTPPEVVDAPDISDPQKAGKTSALRPKRTPAAEDIPVDPTLSGEVAPLPQPMPQVTGQHNAEPHRTPIQRFFPTVSGGTGRDPAGNNR